MLVLQNIIFVILIFYAVLLDKTRILLLTN
nr:MAG TPA: hypothetical protein [Caudoviricetes sp.]